MRPILFAGSLAETRVCQVPRAPSVPAAPSMSGPRRQILSDRVHELGMSICFLSLWMGCPALTLTAGCGHPRRETGGRQEGKTEIPSAEVAPTSPNAATWTRAEQAWQDFVGPYLEEIRREEHDPCRSYVEFRSARVTRFGPDHRIYVVMTRRMSRSALFAVSRSGQIVDLGQGDSWSHHQGYLRNPPLTSFLGSLGMTIRTAEDAIEVKKLVDELASASNKVFLSWSGGRIRDRRIVEPDMLTPREVEAHWLHRAKREGDRWIVTYQYVGPPASTMAPWTWELLLNHEGTVTDIRALLFTRPEGGGPDAAAGK